ncbi:MAG TPA: T9SS type A sorting domain-containing protein [Caldithrix abyssi]|uniref:T9SS type A sorting domain-containing protein n=1 Tax=Caldithrix abyssi TaxID=187145 RepID=A0A7V4U3S8_CALAY|nr:T9SS type A sorting domain-containing protein [Caldithrix abyssi]
MKFLSLVTSFVFLPAFLLFAQIEEFGINDLGITSLAISSPDMAQENQILVAGTDSNGVYLYCFGMDCGWQQIGFAGVPVSAVGIQSVGAGPADWQRIYAALPADSSRPDSGLVYYYDYPPGFGWVRADSGLNRDSVKTITSFTAIGYGGHEPHQPVFCCAETNVIFQKYPESDWAVSWQGDSINFYRVLYNTQPRSGMQGVIWAGGGTIPPALWSFVIFAFSSDYGQSWNPISAGIGEIYSCYSIASSIGNSDTLYAGLNYGAIIKSCDAGNQWKKTELDAGNTTFYGLAVNPQNPDHLIAGGVADSNVFALYESRDGGQTWADLGVDCDLSGITCMVGREEDQNFAIYFGTQRKGVYVYRTPLTGIEHQPSAHLPGQTVLYPNYPNPFNPQTTIVFQSGRKDAVSLAIYDINGRKIRQLIRAVLPAGKHVQMWDGRDDAGNLSASGIYIVSLKVGREKLMRKIILEK